MIEEVRKINIKFKKWVGKPLKDTQGNKPVLDINGEPLFAELAYLRHLEKEGWKGVWINNWRNKFQDKMPFEQPDGINIPKDKRELLLKLWNNNGGRRGTWDIFAWKDDKILFGELKLIGEDKIRSNQIKFYRVALESGLNKEDFIIVEWKGL